MKKFTISTLIISALMAMFALCPCFAENEKELFDQGVALFKQERFQDAADKFTSLLEQTPNNADVYKNRGVCYMKLEKYDLAIADFERAKELFPELKGLYSNLGVAFYYKKEYEKALVNYNKEIEITSDNYIAHFNRALCLSELRRDKEALDALNKTLEIKPGFYWALCYLADLFSRSGDTAKAIESYEAALRSDPANAYAKDKLAAIKGGKPTGPALAGAPKTKENSTKSPYLLSIQAGAFLSRANADNMKAKLSQNGFDADIINMKDTKDRDWFLVRTGSYASMNEAKKAASVFKEKTGLEPAIRPSGSW